MVAGEAGGDPLEEEEAEFDRELRLEWHRVLSDWPYYKAKQSEHIRDLVRQGVPFELRPKIWKLLADAQPLTQQTSEYYRNTLKRPSDYEKLIQRDIARTYPEIDYFKDEAGPGQQGLFNVIKVYSLFDEEVGYCQGSPFIVGLLLLQLGEEESFLLFCKIMQDYRMREIYKPTMAELGLCMYQLECLVQDQLPVLFDHFATQKVNTSLYSSSWFLTLFASRLPLHLSYRVMDLFLSEGLEMILRISVAILQISREDLICLDFENLVKYLREDMPTRIKCDPNYLVKCACQVKYDSKKMKKLIKDYNTTVKVRQEEEAIESRRLRTENQLLLERLRMLETENKELADKLIKGQVCRAQEAEDNFVVKRELSQLRASDEEHRVTIVKLEQQIEELERLLTDRAVVHSKEQEMMLIGMQEELVAVKLREAENHFEIDQLNKKITEQELYIKSLRENVPEDPIAQLQEELSAIKMREAEANFAMKELTAKFTELQNMWLDHLQQVHGATNQSGNSLSQPNSLDTINGMNPVTVCNQPNSLTYNSAQHSQSSNNSITTTQQQQPQQPASLTSSLASSNPLSKFFNNSVIKRASGSANAFNNNSGQLDEQQELQRVKQELLTIKLQEANSLAEVKMLRSREMELETQIKIQDNKSKRKEDEFKRVEETIRNQLTELSNQLKEEQLRRSELEWKTKEEQMMMRLKDVENTRLTGELKQKISSLEIKIEEIAAAKKLAESGIEPRDASEFQERVAELQSESFRLDASNRKLQDMEKKNSEREKEGNTGSS